MKTSAIILLALLLAACAETDPYRRLEPAPTPALTGAQVAGAFSARWPESFKCVQTVTLDFGVQTRTLIGYLMVQQPARFRLQGMTEQGLKLFDIAWRDGELTKVSAAEEFDAKVLDNIARDIRRVFLTTVQEPENDGMVTSLGTDGLSFMSASVHATPDGTAATVRMKNADLAVNLVGDPPRVDRYDYVQSARSLYRVDHYEWRDFGDLHLPSTVVLRERGIQSNGPPYKLTIKITELSVRDKPWPDKLFQPEGE